MINLAVQEHENFNGVVGQIKSRLSSLGFKYSWDNGYSGIHFIKDDLTLTVTCFLANNEKQYCYDALLSSSLNHKSVELPYSYDYMGNPKKTDWRMSIYKLVQDISEMIVNIRSIDLNGFMNAKIYYWNKVKGFGFARSKIYAKIFIHISKIPANLQNEKLLGVNITVIVEDKDENIRAVYIEWKSHSRFLNYVTLRNQEKVVTYKVKDGQNKEKST